MKHLPRIQMLTQSMICYSERFTLYELQQNWEISIIIVLEKTQGLLMEVDKDEGSTGQN